MTEERLRRLRERWSDRGGKDAELVRELLSEVQRLQTENAQQKQVIDGLMDIAAALGRQTNDFDQVKVLLREMGYASSQEVSRD